MLEVMPTDLTLDAVAFALAAGAVCLAWLGCWARWRRVPGAFFLAALAVTASALLATVALPALPVRGTLLSAGAGALVASGVLLPLLTVVVQRARSRVLRRMHLRAVLDLPLH